MRLDVAALLAVHFYQFPLGLLGHHDAGRDCVTVAVDAQHDRLKPKAEALAVLSVLLLADHDLARIGLGIAVDFDLGVHRALHARPAARTARQVFARVVDRHHGRAGGLPDEPQVRKCAAHILGRVLVGAGGHLRQCVDDDEDDVADGLRRGHQLGDVALLEHVGRQRDEGDVEGGGVDAVEVAQRLHAVAVAARAFGGDVQDAALLGLAAAPRHAARDRGSHIQRNKRLARAARAVDRHEVGCRHDALDQPLDRLAVREAVCGMADELALPTLGRVRPAARTVGLDDLVGPSDDVVDRCGCCRVRQLDHRSHRDLPSDRAAATLEAVPLAAQSLLARVLVPLARPLIPKVEALFAAVGFVVQSHTNPDPLIAAEIGIDLEDKLAHALFAQTDLGLTPCHEVVGIDSLRLGAAEATLAHLLDLCRDGADRVLQPQQVDVRQHVAGDCHEAVRRERLEAELGVGGWCLAVAEIAAHNGAHALAARAELGVARADSRQHRAVDLTVDDAVVEVESADVAVKRGEADAVHPALCGLCFGYRKSGQFRPVFG